MGSITSEFILKFLGIAALLAFGVGVGAIFIDTAHLEAVNSRKKTFQKFGFWVGLLFQGFAVGVVIIWLTV